MTGLCPKCGGCCEWIKCGECDGSGYSYHDCGDDSCCCLDPKPNVECDECSGDGGWWECEWRAIYDEEYDVQET